MFSSLRSIVVVTLALSIVMALECFSLEPVSAETASGSTIVVVVTRESTITDLTSRELRRIFLGEATVRAGNRIVPLNQPPRSKTRVACDQNILRMSPDAGGRYWVDRSIRGQGNPLQSIPAVPTHPLQ